MGIYKVDYSGTSFVEAESEKEARVKFIAREVIVDTVDCYGLKITLQKGEPIPSWRGCMDGMKAVQTEKEA